MAKFDLKGLLNDRSVPDRQQDQKIVYRNPKDLIPSEENFYNTEKLERLKQSIKLLGILQPLLIENRDGKDYVIAGHCRRKCCIDLLNEGNDRFSRVPCIYKTQSELEQDACQENDIVRQIMIIQANCYRDKSDWEKMTETLKMEGLVKELREKSPMEGKTRDILKDLIGTSGGQLGRYHAISTNLCEQLMSEFKEDRIKISVAYEASKLNKEYQKQACELYEEAGVLTLDDIRDLYRQQEAEKKTVALSIRTTKLTGKVLAAALGKVARAVQKHHRKALTPQGRQSVKKLMNHYGGKNAMPYVGAPKDFDRIAKEFHVDYAFHKVSPGHYLLFFKANQADAITAAFQKYSAKVLNKEQDKASILGQLRKFTEQIRTQAKEKQRTREAVKDGR